MKRKKILRWTVDCRQHEISLPVDKQREWIKKIKIINTTGFTPPDTIIGLVVKLNRVAMILLVAHNFAGKYIQRSNQRKPLHKPLGCKRDQTGFGAMG